MYNYQDEKLKYWIDFSNVPYQQDFLYCSANDKIYSNFICHCKNERNFLFTFKKCYQLSPYLFYIVICDF